MTRTLGRTLWLFCALTCLAVASCDSRDDSTGSVVAPAGSGASGGASGKTPVTVAFVTNNPSDFWQIAKAGVTKAEAEFGVTCDFQMPPDGTAADQQRIVESLMAK